MNWKLLAIGGAVFYTAVFVVGFLTKAVIHEGILDASYRASAVFWRPELTQDPPDMAGIMPLRIFNGLVTAFALSAVYLWIRPAFGGAGWQKGLSYGVVLTLFAAVLNLRHSGVFNLPGKIWFWWTIDTLILFVAGAVALGWAAEKIAPSR